LISGKKYQAWSIGGNTERNTEMANRDPNRKGLMPAWKPGQSGNPSGRPRMQPISDRYAHIAEQKLPENIRKKLKLGPGATYGDAIALRTFQAALEGDIAATREVREAIEGKAAIRVTEEVRESPQVDLSAIPTRHVPVRPN
jgi:hypothetical protein